MKILAIHADYINFEAKKQAVKAAEKIKEMKQSIRECLVVFMAVEKSDEGHQDNILEQLTIQVQEIAKQLQATNVVLYPYAHLSSNLATLDFAQDTLLQAEKRLKKSKLSVAHAPFGWYKAFEISCKGHPLSELSRQINPSEQQSITSDQPFAIQKEPLSDEQKIALTTAFVVGKSIKDVFSKAQIGGVGFYQNQAYVDIKGVKLKEKDLEQIKSRVKKTLKANFEIEKVDNTVEPLQQEIAKDLGKDAIVYKMDDVTIVPTHKNPFVKVNLIRSFKLLSISSAYWKNNSQNDQLVRINLVAYDSREKLQEFEAQLKKAQDNSHIKIGKEQGLFFTHEISPGSPFFSEKGTTILNELESFFREIYFEEGYQEVRTPNIYSNELWRTSGHWEHYQDDMFFIKDHDMAVKPMNCPGHCILYKSDIKSYRDLPVRIAEFGVLHRNELSGTLHGLTRVRRFIQDDAHIFCRQDQIEAEIASLIRLVEKVYKTFDLHDFTIELSTRPNKALGEKALWDKAEDSLKKAIESSGYAYELNPGDGAFYGPKIDVHIKDSFQRSHQLGTIQLDFQMPARFGLTYEGSDGKKHAPVMIHRAILGSLERFLAILIEHTSGKFPVWLNPTQVKIVTVTDRNISFAQEVLSTLRKRKIRAYLDDRTLTLGKKIREAQLQRAGYILTIGDEESKNRTLAVRTLDGQVTRDVKLDVFVEEVFAKISQRL